MAVRQCPVCERTTDAALCPEHRVPTVDPTILSSTPRRPELGEVVAGRYLLDGTLGVGGMAVVHRARDRVTGRTVALKLMQPPQRLELRHVKRFWREARALAEVAHPHVIGLLEFGIDEGSRLPYLAMEYVDGENLGDRLLRALVDERTACALLAPVARALAAAHAQGFLHRDLKPDNVMIARDGRVVVLDFGVAKALRGFDERITAPGAAVGTPQYMSPEQARGQAVDERSDLYSLGCILHAAVAGRPPFDDDDPRVVLDQQIGAPAPPLPRALVDGRPPSVTLLRLAAALLAKEPAGRPDGAEAVAEVLELLARGEGAAASARLSQATSSVAARASARARIAAAPTGHAESLDALVRPPPARAVPAPADTAVAPRELERPLDEPSLVRTAPTAWAMDAMAATRAGVVMVTPGDHERTPIDVRSPTAGMEALDRTRPDLAQTPVDAVPAMPVTSGDLMRIALEEQARARALAATGPMRVAPTAPVPLAAAAPRAVEMAFTPLSPVQLPAVVSSPSAPSVQVRHERAGPSVVALVALVLAALGVGAGGMWWWVQGSSAGVVGVEAMTGAAAPPAVPTPTPTPTPTVAVSPPPADVPAVLPSPIAAPAASARASAAPRRAPDTKTKTDDRARRRSEAEPLPTTPAAAPTTTAPVTVTSVPAGAQVFRGAELLGRTPLVLRVEAETALRVVLDGYAERKIVLRPGEAARPITLFPLF